MMDVYLKYDFQRLFLNDTYHIEKKTTIMQSPLAFYVESSKWGTCHSGLIIRNINYENSTKRL